MTLATRIAGHFDTAAYHRENRIPVVPGLRFTRDGLIHFKRQTLPVLGSTASVEISGSTTRTGGLLLNVKHDDRKFWLIIDGPHEVFQIPVTGPFAETQVRKLANHINVANK